MNLKMKDFSSLSIDNTNFSSVVDHEIVKHALEA